jgi:SAM-dependent methyltransferase
MSEWFKGWFNEDYALVYPHRDSGEAAQLLALFETHATAVNGKSVLDACCGLGRMSFALNNAGASVSAFDLSDYFISRCKEFDANQQISFSVLDVRDMAWQNRFDAIFQIFTSFGYFETLKENLAVFDGVHSALKSGGYYLFDFLNAPIVIDRLQPETKTVVDGIHILQERSIKGNRVNKKITITENGESRRYLESVALVEPEDIRTYLGKIGFTNLNEFGNYTGADFNAAQSDRYIVLAQKA